MMFTSSKQSGYALVESLVAILVFTVGIVGLLKTQGSVIAEQSQAKFRSDAAYLATSIIGQMRADVTNLASYSNTSDSTCSSSLCQDWIAHVTNTLPLGHATIGVNQSTGQVDVSVIWTSADGTHNYTTTAQIQ